MGWSSEPKRSRAASAASTSTATTASTGVGRPRRRRTETTGSSKTVRGPTATTDGAGGRRSAPTSPPPRSARVTMGFGPVGASPPRHQKAPPRAPMRSPTTPDGPWAARAATARVSSRMAGSGTRARRAASTSTGSTAVAPSGRTNTSSSGTASRMRRHRAWASTSSRTSARPSVGSGAAMPAAPSLRARTSMRPPTETAPWTVMVPRWRERTVDMCFGLGPGGKSGVGARSLPTLRGPPGPPEPPTGQTWAIGRADGGHRWHP